MEKQTFYRGDSIFLDTRFREHFYAFHLHQLSEGRRMSHSAKRES